MRHFFAPLCLLLLTSCATLPDASAIRPDTFWRDEKGVHINAHGGGILRHNGRWWWYGEHKVRGAIGNTAQVGVRVYSSGNLVDWRDEGVALRVEPEGSGSDLEKGCILERPKVLYCARTGQFVMYFHLELKGQGYAAARTGIAVSEAPQGPFRFLRSLRPLAGKVPLGFTPRAPLAELHRRFREGGQMARDMTLFLDDDGRAYHIYASEENQTLQVAELTPDFLDYTGRYVRIAVGDSTEAPALCKRDGWYYLIGSGCTGWAPNAARLYAARSLFGPWTRLDNPCRGVNPHNGLGPEKTWGGQSTCFIPPARPGDPLIACFDLWTPQNPIDGRYIWLPVTFGEPIAPGLPPMLTIHWQDAWSLVDCASPESLAQ